jgi:polar amino acid transport system substrate-binding protein
MKRLLSLMAVLLVIPLCGFSLDTVELLTTEYEPFCGVKGNTMWCDLVNASFSREGINVTWQSYPQDREKSLVSDGTSVAFLSSTLVVSQAEKPNFVMNDNPMIYVSIVAFYPKAKYPTGLGLKGAGDLKGNTVGVVRGTGSVAVLQKAGVTIDEAPDKDLLMKKLLADRYPMAVIADLTGLYALQQFSPDKVDDYKYDMVYSSPIDLIFSKSNPRAVELRTKFNSGMAKIKADGTFMKILAKYYPNGQVNKSILPKDLQ